MACSDGYGCRLQRAALTASALSYRNLMATADTRHEFPHPVRSRCLPASIHGPHHATPIPPPIGRKYGEKGVAQEEQRSVIGIHHRRSVQLIVEPTHEQFMDNRVREMQIRKCAVELAGQRRELHQLRATLRQVGRRFRFGHRSPTPPGLAGNMVFPPTARTLRRARYPNDVAVKVHDTEREVAQPAAHDSYFSRKSTRRIPS
jgi:hypothetical protein